MNVYLLTRFEFLFGAKKSQASKIFSKAYEYIKRHKDAICSNTIYHRSSLTSFEISLHIVLQNMFHFCQLLSILQKDISNCILINTFVLTQMMFSNKLKIQ